MSGKNKTSSPAPLREVAEELYENAPCGYVSFLSDGTIYNINTTLLTWLGFSRDEVVGQRKFNSLFKIGGKIFFETHFFPLIRIQGFIKEISFDIVRKDKSTFPGLLNVNEVSTSDQKTYRATVFDITDRKLYENELLQAKKKAESASEAKAEFLATISHEIRTPLNAILGIANLLKNTNLDEQQKEYVRILLLSSGNLLGLVNNLLDLSKIEAQKVKLEQKPFHLFELLEVLISTYEMKVREKDIDLITQFEKDVPAQLCGDPVKLNQILTNLLGNAIKFTRKGHVKLQVQAIKKEEDHTVLRFTVSDTGIGIPEDKLETIFQKYTQASYEVNKMYGGTGLGLNISQKLLELHGSVMQVSSTLGKGSEFSFDIKFKLNKELPQAGRAASPEDFPQQLSTARILIVDDNKINIFIVSQYLKQWNLDHDSAENGQEALAAVQENHYDLILMDLHMPHLDGYEASRKIRKLELDKQPVIIALSASGRGDIDIKQRRAGINDYVTKPFRPEELFDALARNLEISSSEPEKIVPHETTEEQEEDPKEKEVIKEGPLLVNSSFDLSRIMKMAGNNSEFLRKVINSTLEAFEDYKKDFEAAAQEKNPKKVEALLHKSTMSIFYVNANKLTKLLEQTAELLSENSGDHYNERESLKVKNEFDRVITGLRAVKEQLSSISVEH